MPVRFTYANFPSLWDDIIASADLKARLVIRSLDRGLRHAIDTRQVRHLVLSPDPGNVVTVRGPLHSAAALKDLSPDAVRDADRTLCEHTSVIDVRGFFHPTFDLRPLAPLFPGLKVLRMTSDSEQQVTPYVPFPTETLVLFTNPSGLGGVYEHWYFRHPSEPSSDDEPGSDVENDHQYEVHGRRLAPRGVSRHRLPEKCRKMVVNMCGDHAPPSTMWPVCENPPPHVRDVVIVVPRYKALDGEGEMDPGCVESVLAIGILEMLRAPGPNFTLVGIDEASGEYEDKLRELLRTDAAQVVHADVDYSIDDPLTSEMPVQIRRFAQEASEQMRLAREENPEGGHSEEQLEPEVPAGSVNGGAVSTVAEAAAASATATGAKDVPQAGGDGTEVEPATSDDHNGDHEVVQTGDDLENAAEEIPTATAGPASNGSAPSTPDGPVIPPSASTMPLVSLQQKVDNLFARIEFLSKEQYIERVGEETAALELLEYLDPSEFEKGASG